MESIGDVIGKFVDMNKFNAMTDKVIARPEIEKFISDNKITELLHPGTAYGHISDRISF